MWPKRVKKTEIRCQNFKVSPTATYLNISNNACVMDTPEKTESVRIAHIKIKVFGQAFLKRLARVEGEKPSSQPAGCEILTECAPQGVNCEK